MIDRKRFVEEGLWLVGSVATVLVFMIVIMRLVEGPAPTLSQLATVFVVVYGIVIFVRLSGLGRQKHDRKVIEKESTA